MGDVRFRRSFERVRGTDRPHDVIDTLPDAEVAAALAGAAMTEERDPYLLNVLATEATNRVQRLAITLEHVGEGVVALDAEGRVRFLNPAAERMLKWTEHELWHRNFHEVVKHRAVEAHRTLTEMDGSALPEEECSILEALRTGKRIHRVDHDVFESRDGQRFIAEFTAVPVFADDDEDGTPEGVVVIFRNDTERIRTEDELRVFRTTTEHAAQGVAWVRRDGSFLYANPAAAKALGRSVEEVRALTVFDVDPNITRDAWPGLWDTIEAEGTMEIETTHRTKDGSTPSVTLVVDWVNPAGAGEPFLVVFCYHPRPRHRTLDLRS